MFNKERLNEIAKCPSVYDMAESYIRTHQGTIGIEIYVNGALEVINRIEDKLNFYCDRPNEFYGAIERIIKELKGE